MPGPPLRIIRVNGATASHDLYRSQPGLLNRQKPGAGSFDRSLTIPGRGLPPGRSGSKWATVARLPPFRVQRHCPIVIAAIL